MVKVGFIVEGFTEKVVIESAGFQSWTREQGIEVIHPVVNATGGGNLLPQNIGPMVRQLSISQPDHIVILTDREREPSVQAVRQRIGTKHTNLVFVAVKAIEAWFLADTAAMGLWLEDDNFEEPAPEATPDLPWDYLKELANRFEKRGPGSRKPKFAERMVRKQSSGGFAFSIASAAQHPACPSAKEFHDELIALGVTP
ncbi:hypothetical protein [Pelagibaculum spongiae]|uniref:DUF4276 domain-containing protein n=1 Tax=Pelagibaculum spongiae TaxID=2080658 RepID=A0A2V1GRC2_9GAMM|nr:hypothetical protein [Pelagibaculum spongiae]PVZ66782.1 hypothetical protein DC094_16085 [Pelagibaculum spongiae]